MSTSLSISEAAAILADLPASVGFPTDVRDDTSSNNVVSFKKSKGRGGLSIAQGASLLAEAESGRGNSSRSRQLRDPGGDLSIEDGARLLLGETSKKVEGRLTKSQGVDLLMGRKARTQGGELTKSEAVQLLASGNTSDRSDNSYHGSAASGMTDYVIESQNAAISFQNAEAALRNFESNFWAFVHNAAAAFPEVVQHGHDAVMRMPPVRFAQYLTLETEVDKFKEIARSLYAYQGQAWSQAVHVENMEFLAKNPDFEDSESSTMASILVAVVGENEALALAGPNATVSASDPRIIDVLKVAAGSDDGDAIIQLLVGAGFSNMDIAAIANGTARCHLMDHRVRTVLLRAARNVQMTNEEN
jgi:hypothetical protein